MIGGGVVGGGVAELLSNMEGVQLHTIVVRDAAKLRDWAVPKGCALSMNVNDVLNDDRVRIVIEVMGGVSLAKKYVMSALRCGKHVVTANKAMLAAHMAEFEDTLLDTATQLRFSAAVGGGIPIVATLQKHMLMPTPIRKVYGIMNGTTNAMLCMMERRGVGYAEALAEAQARGLAEADPSEDVMGIDAANKLCILSRLAFGTRCMPNYVVGIERIVAKDFALAKQMNCTIRLIACSVTKQFMDAEMVAALDDDDMPPLDTVIDDDHVQHNMFVMPCFVPLSHPLARVNGAHNRFIFNCTCDTDGVQLYGLGAGRLPTARNVVADVMRTIQTMHRANYAAFPRPAIPEMRPLVQPVIQAVVRFSVEGDERVVACVERAFDAVFESLRYSIDTTQRGVTHVSTLNTYRAIDDAARKASNALCVLLDEFDVPYHVFPVL